MSSRPNVNPFYIEPSKRAAWEDDFDIDEAEVEGEALLPTRRNGPIAPSHWEPPPRRRHAAPRNNRRILCFFGSLVILLLLVLSATTKEGDDDGSSSSTTWTSNYHNATTTMDDTTTAPQPVTDDTFKPIGVPTQSPVHSPTDSPVASTVAPTSAPVTQSPVAGPASSTTTNAPTVASTTSAPTKAPVETSSPTTSVPTRTPTDSPSVTTQSPAATTSSTEHQHVVADELVLFGLRNSGLDWYADKLRKCYPNQTVSTRLTRETIWFQDRPTVTDSKRRVFVFLTRNVYDWVEAMRLHPDRIPAHTHVDDDDNETTTPLSWMDFVKLAWKPPGPIVSPANASVVCQFGFTPQQVVPCTIDANPKTPTDLQPTYELDSRGGNTFPNILALRAAKIRHFVQELPAWWDPVSNNTHTVPYEKGFTLALLDSLTNWTHACPTDNLMKADDDTKLPSEAYTDTEITYLRDNVDWEAETLIGYTPRDG